jgi:hypothetical protein
VVVKQVRQPDPHRAALLRALDEAPTVLEAMLWGWLLGHPDAKRLYFEELMITDLVGPGDVPDDFEGERT